MPRLTKVATRTDTARLSCSVMAGQPSCSDGIGWTGGPITPSEFDTVSVLVVARLLDQMARAGIDVARIEAAVGLSRGVLGNLDERLSLFTLHRIWSHAERVSGDCDVGLHLAERFGPAMLDVLGYAVRNCPTLGDGLAMVARYYRLVRNGAEVWFRRQAAVGSLVHRSPPSALPAGRHGVESLLAGLVLAGRRGTGVSWSPIDVAFQHDAPRMCDTHRRLFGCPVHFGLPVSSLTVNGRDLDRPMRDADPELSQVLERHARAMVERVTGQPPLTERVRSSLVKHLSSGHASLGTVARDLAMGPRTLQRRLRSFGSSFQQLNDATRHELAQAYLADPRLSVAEVAFLLGYASQSTFHRAFKTWTGQTPGAFRRVAE